MKKNFLDYTEEYLCMGVLAFMTVLIFLQVVLRYCFSFSITWCEELCRYLFVWISWIGASYCVKIDAHLRVTAFVGFVPKRHLPYFNLFMYICWAAFAGLLAVKGCELAYMAKYRGQVSTAMKVPMWIPIASVPVGSALMTFRLFAKIKQTFGEIKQLRECANHD